MELKKMNVDDLVPAEYNPRLDLKPGDKEFEKLKRSIETFGLVEPIIFNERTGRLVGGHQRLKVIQELGWQEVEVSVVDLHESDEKALNVALNKIEGGWDKSKLKDLLEELDNGAYDLEVTGFEINEIEQLMTEFFNEDEEIKEDDSFDINEAEDEARENPRTTFGELWQLGNHRLLVGDATNENDVLRLMNDEQADMVFTDPPYNVNYEGKTSEKLKIENDSMADDDFYQFILDSYKNMEKVLIEGGPFYICHADTEWYAFRTALGDADLELKQVIVWVKDIFVMGRQDYHWKHEPILYGWKPGAAHKWYGGRKQSTVVDFPVDLDITEKSDHSILTFNSGASTISVKVDNYEVLYDGTDELMTTWRINKPQRNAEHPTMKPIKLCARAILNSCKREGIVFDSFGGSGSTLMASEQTGRRCNTIEYNPVYADVIIKRWEEYTGKKAVRLS